MPPKGKLPEATIAVARAWVSGGAAMPHRLDPATAPAAAGARRHRLRRGRKHWAYQPIRGRDPRRSRIEAGRVADRPLRAGEARSRGLTPSPPADRRTLLRRVYFDLIGLPPTAEEVEAFESDRSPDAFARVVDRLLASPHYGERWGRHWLDVARYADTKDGVLMFGDDRVRPFAYTYRDYVIRGVQRRPALRPVRPRAARRRRGRAQGPALAAGGDGLPDAGPDVRQQHPRPDRRPHRHGHPRLPGPDGRLRPLPRPQVRRHPDGRLLLALRRLRQQRGPARAAADRPARTHDPASRRVREAGRGQAARAAAVPRQPVQAALRDGAAADGRLPGPGRHDAARPARDGDLLPVAGPRRPAAADRRPLAALPRAAVDGRRSGLRPLARPDGAAGRRLRREGRRGARPLASPPAGTEPGQFNPLVAEALGQRRAQGQGRRRPRLRRADPPASTRRPRAAAATISPARRTRHGGRSARSSPTARARPISPRARPITTCRAARRTPSAASSSSSTG